MFAEKSRIAGVSRLVVGALAILLSSASAKAAFVTIDEAAMTDIFSQASFGATPISIRFNPVKVIVAPQLLVIDNLAELGQLYGLAPDPAPTVTAFFVDTINACGVIDEPTVSAAVIGCAQLPGNVFVEDSSAAAVEPGALMGHELGHNLDLGHSTLGIMTAIIGFGDGHSLDTDQVATILKSPLVQTDSTTGERFIQISPILIADTPEPSTLLLLSAGLGGLLVVKKKKATGIRPS